MTSVKTCSGINYCESSLTVKTLETSNERIKAYKLRYESFVEELGWIEPFTNRLEMDQYDDERMIPLGVMDPKGNVIAHLRITLPNFPFMMEHERMAKINQPIEKNGDTVEISRVCTHSSTRKMLIETSCGKINISLILYKGLYQWSKENGINVMYMVVEKKLYRLLKLMGFPCLPIGDITQMPDGAITVAIRITWDEFDRININSRPGLYKWFNTVETQSIDQKFQLYNATNPYRSATATA